MRLNRNLNEFLVSSNFSLKLKKKIPAKLGEAKVLQERPSLILEYFYFLIDYHHILSLGIYWLDPNGGNKLDAFQASCVYETNTVQTCIGSNKFEDVNRMGIRVSYPTTVTLNLSFCMFTQGLVNKPPGLR